MDRPSTRRRVLAAGGTALFGAVAGCLDGSGTGDQSEDGDAGGMGAADDVAATVVVGPDGLNVYDPEEVRIDSGSTVRWVWESGPHTLTPQQIPEGADWRGDPTRHSESFEVEYTLDVAGAYQYQCSVHDDMVGVVHVQ